MSNSTATKAKAASSTGSRRSKKNQDETLNHTVTLEPTEANQESTLSVDKGTQLMTMPELKIQPAPEDEASIAPLPGNRPISSSDLKLSNVVSIMGNRPVDASNIQVLGIMSAMGERPIIASNIKVADVISVSGERPIAASAIQILETEMIMGNRPIASNYIDSGEDLMGYLD